MDTTITPILATLARCGDTLNQTLNTKSAYDWIPIVTQILILLVLFITAFLILRQLNTQKKMLDAQLLKDRIMLGWQTDEPITLDHINNVEFLPDGYIPRKYRDMYMKMKIEQDAKKKKEMELKIGKYLYLTKVYVYFKYAFITYHQMKLTDPWGYEWWQNWLDEDKIFMEVREFNKNNHDVFEEYLTDLIKQNNEN